MSKRKTPPTYWNEWPPRVPLADDPAAAQRVADVIKDATGMNPGVSKRLALRILRAAEAQEDTDGL